MTSASKPLSHDSSPSRPSTAICLLILTAACAAVFLPALGTMPLVDPDEARCAAVVQDMLRTGQWLMPHLEGGIYFDKPAPFFWLAAGLQKVTGSIELGGRLVAALAAWAAVLLTYSLMRRVAGSRTGLIAGLILATSLMFVHLGRWYRMDMPLAAAVLAALWWYWRYESPVRRRCPGQWIGFYAFGALAVLLKGPAGLVLPVAVVATYLLLTRQQSRWREFFNYWGVLTLIVLAAPWYLAAGLRYPIYFEKFFVEQNVERFASKEFGGRTLFGIGYIFVLIGGMIPWSMYLVPAIRHVWPKRRGRRFSRRYTSLSALYRRRRRGFIAGVLRPIAVLRLIVTRKAMRFDRGHLFVALAVGVPLVLFMLARTQMPPYILPILAPMAGLLAMPLAKWIDSVRVDRWLRRANVYAVISLVLLAGTVCGAAIYLRWADAWLAAPIAAAAIAGVAMIAAMRKRRPAAFVAATVAGLLAVLVFAATELQPRLYEEKSLRSLAAAMPPSPDGSPRKLCCWSDIRHSLTVYSGAPYTIRFEDWPGGLDLLARYLMQQNSCCLWTEPEDGLAALDKVAEKSGRHVVTLGRKGRFILLKFEQSRSSSRPDSSTMPEAGPDLPSGSSIGWRGDGTGVFNVDSPPTEWDEDSGKNILWSVKVGLSMYSSPIVVGDKVFMLVDEDKLVCVDAVSGKVLWEKPNGLDQLPEKPDNPEEIVVPGTAGNTTPCPCSDGKNVFVRLGIGIVACYDLEGNRRWIRYLPEAPSEYGRSSSPILAGGKLIVMSGAMMALDPADGKTLWQCPQAQEEYGTPCATRIGGVDVIVSTLGQIIDASSGKRLSKGVGRTTYASPFCQDGVAYFLDVLSVAGRLPDKLDGGADPRKLWSADLEGDFYSTGVVYDGIAYAASDQGNLFALDAKTGELLWQQELEIPSASGRPGAPPSHLYASLAVAGKHIYLTNIRGDTYVLEPGRQYKEIARNRLNEGGGGNLFFVGNRIYARGGEFLYCIGSRERQP